ncbi:MAG TPA: CRISPR-associated protein Cas4 [Candidatus Cloacimonas sp.]|nr:CRISPR-associated protein Cas4 [Candidatus Cloacimonadota bacterium]HCM15155.1 CRISPR-associated protein Cas4 [Candidatus Cloacimonas sp.]
MNTVDFQFITPSHVLHYLFCPRFAYFLYVLHIDEHENRRRLVMKGRDIHALKMVQNKEYLRSKIGVKDKVIDLYLSSHKLHLVGRVDEALFLNDGTAAPLDYKFAFWENRIYKTLRIQQTLYALLIEEKYNIPVHKAYLVYVRSKNHIEELPITLETKKNALDIVHEIFSIVNDGSFPNAKVSKRKCEDCAFRNICVR